MSKIFTQVIVHTVTDLTNHYWLSEIVIWIKKQQQQKTLKILNALLSLFLTAYHYSLVVFFPAKDTKAGAIEGWQTWMSLTLSDTECQLRHTCQPQTWSHQDSQALCILDSYLPFGVAPPGFQPDLAAWKKQSVQYTSHFSIHSTQAMAICSRNGFSSLTAEYQECLKADSFDVHYQCISAWLHCDCSTRMRCADTFCWHLSLIYLYREDAWNVPVS